MKTVPVEKNRRWLAAIHTAVAQLEPATQAALMRPAGEACASDILRLCARVLGRPLLSVEDLLAGWNRVREERGLGGRWQSEGETMRGLFSECGCPLVRSGLIELHPSHCYCSHAMLETIFSRVAQRPVQATIAQAIGWGDAVCEFVIRFGS